MSSTSLQSVYAEHSFTESSAIIHGPNQEKIDEVIYSWIGTVKTPQNDVIFDLAHRIDCSKEDLIRGLSQWIHVDGMRTDTKGLSLIHLLALQGRLEILEGIEFIDPPSIGGRSVGHFLALAGHIGKRESIRYLIERSIHEIGIEDEYGGTELNIDRLVSRKVCRPMATKYEIPSTHVPSEELLKIWMGTSPKEEFYEGLESSRLIYDRLVSSEIKDSSLELCPQDRLGIGLRAKKDIPAGAKFLNYDGVYNYLSFLRNAKQSKNFMHFASWIDNPERRSNHSDLRYLDGMCDASFFSSKMAHINDGLMPNVSFLQSMNYKGLAFSSYCVAIKPIKAGEFLKVRYDNHPVRIATEYVENEIELKERISFLKTLARLPKDFELSLAHKEATINYFATPYVFFDDLIKKRFSKDLFVQIVLKGIQNSYISETYPYLTSVFSVVSFLRDEDIPLFFQNWILPIFKDKILLCLENPQLLYVGIQLAIERFARSRNVDQKNTMRLFPSALKDTYYWE
jgi:hypothetical protein